MQKFSPNVTITTRGGIALHGPIAEADLGKIGAFADYHRTAYYREARTLIVQTACQEGTIPVERIAFLARLTVPTIRKYAAKVGVTL